SAGWIHARLSGNLAQGRPGARAAQIVRCRCPGQDGCGPGEYHRGAAVLRGPERGPFRDAAIDGSRRGPIPAADRGENGGAYRGSGRAVRRQVSPEEDERDDATAVVGSGGTGRRGGTRCAPGWRSTARESGSAGPLGEGEAHSSLDPAARLRDAGRA